MPSVWNFVSSFFQRHFGSESDAFSISHGQRQEDSGCKPVGNGQEEPFSPLDRQNFRKTLTSSTFEECARAEKKDVLLIPVNRLMYLSGILVPPPKENFYRVNQNATQVSPEAENQKVRETVSFPDDTTVVNIVDCDEFTQAILLRELARFYFARYFVTIPQVQEVSFLFRAIRSLAKDQRTKKLSLSLERDIETLLHFLLTRFRFGRSNFVREQSHFFKELVLEWERR